MLVYNFLWIVFDFCAQKKDFFFHFNRTAEPDQSILIPARRPLAAGDAGLETGYQEKICHHDGRTTTTDDGQKITPLIVGAQFSFWSFFIDFELMSNFFVVQEKNSRQIVCFSG